MSVFKISLKNAFVYRGSVIFNIIGSICKIFIAIALWRYVYSYDTEKTNYMILYVILSNIISMFYSRNMCNEIGEKVANGTFAIELIRPVNFVFLSYMKMVGQIIADIAMKGFPAIVCFSPLIIKHFSLIHEESMVIFFVVILLDHILFSVLYALIGFMAFICMEVWPFERLMADTIRFLSGSFLPLTLFPKWLRTVANFLPFSYLYSFPIDLLLGQPSQSEITTNVMMLCGWIVALVIVFCLLFRRAVNAFVVQGG